MTIPDAVAALVAFLKANTGVSALVATRVFGAELPEAEAASMPRKAVVVKRAGGAGSGGFVELENAVLAVIHYGETPLEAEKVRLAVHEAIKFMSRKKQGDTLFHGFNQAGGPVSLRDPDTHWPFVVESWQMLVSEVQLT